MTPAEKQKAKFDEQKARVLELHNQGMYCVDISRRLGISNPTVIKWLRLAGVQPLYRRPEISRENRVKVRTGKFAGLK